MATLGVPFKQQLERRGNLGIYGGRVQETKSLFFFYPKKKPGGARVVFSLPLGTLPKPRWSVFLSLFPTPRCKELVKESFQKLRVKELSEFQIDDVIVELVLIVGLG